jgi:hypothetical protein
MVRLGLVHKEGRSSEARWEVAYRQAPPVYLDIHGDFWAVRRQKVKPLGAEGNRG